MQQTYEGTLRRRMTAVLTCFLVVTAVIIAKIVFTATAYGERRVKLRQHALVAETLRVPGLRGSIVDHNQQIVAQSHRRLQIKQAHETGDTSAARSRTTLPLDHRVNWKTITDANLDPHIVFRRSVTPLNAPQTDSLPKAGKAPGGMGLGTTEVSPETGLEYGTSGLELLWDHTLRAKLVTCKILKDYRRVIISNTSPNGRNVHLQD